MPKLEFHAYTETSERSRQSEYSSGVVHSCETLVRTHFHPVHFDSDGLLVASAISSDDLRSKGFSVDRWKFFNRRVVSKRIARQKANSPEQRKLAVCVPLLCRSLRKYIDSKGKRGFLVIDNAEPDNVAHAAVYSAYDRKPSEISELKIALIELLNKQVRKRQKFFVK